MSGSQRQKRITLVIAVTLLILVVGGVVVAVVFAVSDDADSYKSAPGTTTPSADTQTPCGYCGPVIDITLRVQNNLVEPFFNHTLDLLDLRQRELIFILQQAVVKQKQFRFTASYSSLGFFIEEINGLEGDFAGNETWWQIIGGTSLPLITGISSYIPKHEELVIFNFNQGQLPMPP